LKQLESIVAQFRVQGKPVKMTPIKVGLIHQTFLVENKKEDESIKYLLQEVNTFVFKQPEWVVDNIAKVANHLKQKEYPLKILETIETIMGGHLLRDQGKCWRLLYFFDQTFTVNETDDESLAYNAAYAFGEYARYLGDLDCEKLNTPIADFHNTPLRFEHFKRAIQPAYRTGRQGVSERVIHAKKEVDELLSFKALLQSYHQFSHLVRVVHYDTKINNVLLDKSTKKPVAIVDLDTLMPGMLPYDFGDMVRTISPPVDENEKDTTQVRVRENILKAITNGFLDGIKEAIDPIEKENLYNGAALIIYEQALRFLSDYLLGDPYYQVNYPSQNLVRAQNQIVLLKDFLKYL